MKIKDIRAIEILDSRGNPTIEATVVLEDGSEGKAAVPSGASTGKYEAVELRDGDTSRYNGLGVLNAVKNAEGPIKEALMGMDASDQRAIDQKMISLDGTPNKGKLGANAILSISLATARAEAVSEKKPLYEYLAKFDPDFKGTYVMPVPMMNIMNGGRHANWVTDIQEYMVLPINAQTVEDSIRMGDEVFVQLKKELEEKGRTTTVGDEGGFAPSESSNLEPLELITESIRRAGYKPGEDIVLGIDAASSEFFTNGSYELKKDGLSLSPAELGSYYADLLAKYPIKSIEDPFDEDGWESFRELTVKVGDKVQIVGDDLYTTNVERLKKGVEEKATNSILIKVNQIGTLTETIDAILLARQSGMTAIISHRSGETEDAFIADLSVAMGTGEIKAGSPDRSERTAKYNRLIEIEHELGERAKFAKFPF